MKRYVRFPSTALIVAVGFLLAAYPALAADPAPLYQDPTVAGGQVSDLIAGEGGDYTLVWDVYYTKDPLPTVAAFYEGKMAQKTTVNTEKVVFDGPDGSPLKYKAVIIHIPDNGIHEGDLFDLLREELGMNQAGLGEGGHSSQDLQAAQAKYGYLAEEAFFPKFSAAEKLATCRDKVLGGLSGATQDSAALQAKLQELAMQGRFAEMQQYMGQAQNVNSNMEQAMGSSKWDGWIGCLDEIEAGAFRTQINIRTK